MLDSETATHIGVLQGEEWYKPRDLGKQCDIFYASKGKSYDEPERAKWNDSEKRSFNGSWGKQPFGEKKSDNFSSRKNFDKGQVDGTVAARVDLLGKVIPRGAIEDKLSKLVKTSISVDGKLVHALVDSGTEITVIKKDLVPGISVEGASTIYLKGIFGPAVKCPLVYVPIGLATDGQKAQEHIEDSQITSCRNEVGTLGTKDEEVTAEMDKGIMVADSFRSKQECCAEIKDRSSSTPVARPELPFEVGNMDLIGPIDPPSSKGHTYILCLVDQHTRWGEAMLVTSLRAKVLRMLEQFVVSRIVDIDILMQIWKNRVKQINFVLEWVRWVGSEIIPAKGKLEP
ncbi:CCHC-type domain-containing protein [Trichonephila clavipes]|nr:CCHC-type domain-containing protein [Trichonephila clavipes]